MLNLSGNEEVQITPPRPLSLTNVSLAASVAKDDARTSLVLTYVPLGSKSEASVALATLFKNRSDNHMLLVNLSPNQTYVLRADGPNDIDIVGYFPFDLSGSQDETDSQAGRSEDDEPKTENEAPTRSKEPRVKEEVESAEETSADKTPRKVAPKAAKGTRSRPATTKRASPAQESKSSAKAGTSTSRVTRAPAKKASAAALGKRKVKE
ncbi:hypothetical protein MD484_g8312, partial [Candolleomyces efflorescens]